MALLKIRDENGNIIEIPALKGDKGNKGDKGDDGKDGKDGADYILTDDDKSEIAAQVSGDCVSYLEAQNLTDEQKQTARENIGAISQAELDEAVANISGGGSGDGYELTDEDKNEIAGLVEAVSYSQTQNLTDEQKETARNNIGINLTSDDNKTENDDIPTVQFIVEYTDTYTGYDCVRCDKAQNLNDQYKQTARANIGAISQTELDEIYQELSRLGSSIGDVETILGGI